MADEIINGSEMTFSVIREIIKGETPSTGTRLDLPVATSQSSLENTIAAITDDTRRGARETAAPTDGASSVGGSVATSFRPGPATDLLLESALSGVFDADGVLESGENDVSFTMFTTLTDRPGKFLGYQDRGLQVARFSISSQATSDTAIGATWELVGLSRIDLTIANKSTLPIQANTEEAFDYIDVSGLKINDEEFEFTDFEFSTGVPRTQRRVHGKKEAIGLAPGNRETSASFSMYREDFSLNELVEGPPVPVEFIAERDGKSYKVEMPYAKAVRPTDTLSDTGLLATVNFTAHSAAPGQPSVIITRMV